MTYECDICGHKMSRPHFTVAYGSDTTACDDCSHYDWRAYDEEPDPVLHPELVDLYEEEMRAQLAWDTREVQPGDTP